jgi:hypothetical protein
MWTLDGALRVIWFELLTSLLKDPLSRSSPAMFNTCWRSVVDSLKFVHPLTVAMAIRSVCLLKLQARTYTLLLESVFDTNSMLSVCGGNLSILIVCYSYSPRDRRGTFIIHTVTMRLQSIFRYWRSIYKACFSILYFSVTSCCLSYFTTLNYSIEPVCGVALLSTKS